MENIFTENVNTILAGVITTLITIIGIVAQRYLSSIKKRLDSQPTALELGEHEEDIGLSLWCDRAIMDIIAETRVGAGSDRAYVIRFHNGSYFSNRQPIWKLSCTHESTAKGVEYDTTKDVQSLPASNVLDLVVPFWGGISRGVKRVDIPDPTVEGEIDPRNGIYFIDVERLDSSMGKQLLRSEGIKQMINVALVSPITGQVMGIFGLDFLENKELPKDLRKFKEVADRISYILCREEIKENEKPPN